LNLEDLSVNQRIRQNARSVTPPLKEYCLHVIPAPVTPAVLLHLLEVVPVLPAAAAVAAAAVIN